MIKTERLLLKMMHEDDFEKIFRIFSDKNVLKAFNLKSFSKDQMKEWINRNLNHQKKYGYGLFSVYLKSNNELIGDCGLEHTEFEGKTCVEIGYDFLSKYWNKGYATEAASAIKEFAINNSKINSKSLCSFIRSNNIASKRVSEKIGMIKLKEYVKYDIDYYLYGFSSDYF